MTPKPLPPLAQDPDFQEAQALRSAYQAKLVSIRDDRSLSQLGVAEAVAAAWTTASNRLDELAASLRSRRRARLEYLEASVPMGPGIDAKLSPADKAVLFTSWRTSLATARAAEWDDLPRLVDDAVRFGDDMLARAALTAALETRPQQTDAIAKFDAGYPGLLATITEITDLENALTHDVAFPDWLWERQVFTPLDKPAEVDSVETLRALAERQAASGLRPKL
jgi:hypothetical protein